MKNEKSKKFNDVNVNLSYAISIKILLIIESEIFKCMKICYERAKA